MRIWSTYHTVRNKTQDGPRVRATDDFKPPSPTAKLLFLTPIPSGLGIEIWWTDEG